MTRPKEIGTEGKTLVNLLYIFLKTTRIHAANNEAVINAGQNLTSTINRIASDFGSINIQRVYDYIFINDTRIRIDIEGFAGIDFLVELYKAWDIGTIIFHPGVTFDDLIKLAYLLNAVVPEDQRNFTNLKNQFSQESIRTIELEGFLPSIEPRLALVENRERAKQSYFKSILTTREIMESVEFQRSVSGKKIKRTIYSLVNTISEDELSLLGLSTIKNYDEYTYNHSVNVSILALALGQRLGLSRLQLGYLGMAGLFHDIGKTKIDKVIVTKPQSLTDEEWKIMKKHPLFGLEKILTLRNIDDNTAAALVVCFQHHVNADLTGYPSGPVSRIAHLLSRIVRICDAYDAMTTARPYKPVPYLPDRALALMWQKRGTFYDTTLLKIFIKMLGFYPIGTLVQLSSNEIGLVVRPNSIYLDRPAVRILLNEKGENIEGEVIDLAEQYRDPKGFKRWIIKSLRPEAYNITIPNYFI